MIAQLPDPSSFVAMGWVITVLFSIGGGYLLILNIQVARRKLATPALPSGGVVQPLVVQEAEVFVKDPDFKKTVAGLKEEIAAVEERIDGKFTENQTIFRDRFHKLDNDLAAIKHAAEEGREVATEQFQKIEGRLGKLDATAEHNTSLAIRTDQRVAKMAEDLPEKIANAIARNGRRT
jgi:hypothetical protein